jgi:hypothetical protein
MNTPKQNGLSGNWGIAIGFLVLITGVGSAAWFLAPRFYNPPPAPVATESVTPEGERVERIIDGEEIDQQLADEGISEPTDEERAAAAQRLAEAQQAAEDEAARLAEEAKKPGLLGRIFGGEKKDDE